MEKPKEIEKPDFTALILAVNEYMDALEDEDTCEDTITDYENPIFEAAMTAIYGKDCFKYVNKKIEEFN